MQLWGPFIELSRAGLRTCTRLGTRNLSANFVALFTNWATRNQGESRPRQIGIARHQENRSAVSAVAAATLATLEAVSITASGKAIFPRSISTKSRVELIPRHSSAA